VHKHDTLRLVICGNKCVKAMELVETVRDIEAVVHRQKRVVGELGGGGGGRTGMVANGERLSELRGGGGSIYPPGHCEYWRGPGRHRPPMKAREQRGVYCTMRLPEMLQFTGVNLVPNPRLWSPSTTTTETTIMTNGTQPISIETLLQKQKEEQEAASRVSPL